MLGEIIQPPLFKTGPLSDSRLVKLIKLGLDRVAFGVTTTGLKKGDFDVLKYIFYGIHNLDLELFLEIPSIENPGEILSGCFATGGLKKGNRHLENPNISCDFLELKQYLNKCSYNNEKFVSLAHEFKKYFDSSPGKQRERLWLLEQSIEGIGDKFVKSLRSLYRPSDKENSVTYEFHDLSYGRKKGFYVDGIYEKFKSLNERAREKLMLLYKNLILYLSFLQTILNSIERKACTPHL
jgi:hypothetical protein